MESHRERARLFEGLARLPGVRSWPSEANMILIRVPDADRTFAGLKARGVLVKNVSKMHPLLANCLRLTVGTAIVLERGYRLKLTGEYWDFSDAGKDGRHGDLGAHIGVVGTF